MALNSIFFILFFIYAVSPLTASLKESKNYLANECAFGANNVTVWVIDFLYQSSIEDNDVESSQPDDEIIIVKKKRALTKEFDKTSLIITAIVSHIVPIDLFAFSEQQNIEIAFADHKTNPKAFKGFLPLYSGLSPPIV